MAVRVVLTTQFTVLVAAAVRVLLAEALLLTAEDLKMVALVLP
jgi:hypothetical protein